MARTSRWDRPPLPKDMRWFVRLFGKVLICTGLLMFGFVAYQLWGTGIETARAQNRLESEFERLVEERAVTSSTTVPATTVAATSPATTPPTSLDPATSSTLAPSTLPPETVPSTTTPAEPPLLDWSYVTPRGPVGQIVIESVGIDWTFVQGVSRDDLQDGPGHYPSTPFPGELGNASLAGHRTTFGGPFDHLPEVQVGDDIVVTTLNGTYTYVMRDWEVVNPGDGYVINTTDATKATLTLTTCTPRGTASQRYVLYADLDPTRSSPVGRYVPRDDAGVSDLAGDPNSPVVTSAAPTEAPTTPPTTIETTTLPGSVAPTAPGASTTIPAAAAPTNVAETTTTTTTTTPLAALGETSGGDDAEAFGGHWFDDRRAIPQVLGWAAVSTAVVTGAYFLAKRLRNSWIGLAVGVAPFLVTLYFFYQNVNRLLPAAL